MNHGCNGAVTMEIQGFYIVLFLLNIKYAVARKLNPFSNGILTTNCTLTQTAVPVPCIQYTMSSPTYCASEDTLRRHFQGLYELDREQTFWPGPPTDVTPGDTGVNISWKTPHDASITFLKGFQVRLMGNSIESLQYQVCCIIDIDVANSTTDQLLSFMTSTFRLDFDLPGSYAVIIQSLPRPLRHWGDRHTGAAIPVVTLASRPAEYHPNISIHIRCTKINSTHVNVSFTTTPLADAFVEFTIEIFSSEGAIVHRATVPQKYLVLGWLPAGNYTVRIHPVDHYHSDLEKCMCYKGSSTRRQCTPCRYFTDTIEITKDANEPTHTAFVRIGVPMIASSIAVTATAAALYIGWRLKIRRHVQRSTPDTPGLVAADSWGTVYVLHTRDHVHHEAAVEAFMVFLEMCCQCALLSRRPPTPDTAATTGSQQHVRQLINIMNSADVILVIHSELAYEVFQYAQSEHSHIVHKQTSNNDTFVSCIQKISPKSRIISVHFDYTPVQYVIREPFIGPLFQISQHLNALKAHIENMVSCKEIQIDTKANRIYDEVVENLNRRIGESRQFQQANTNWFDEAFMGPLDRSSGNDSGVVLPRAIPAVKHTHSRSCSYPMEGRATLGQGHVTMHSITGYPSNTAMQYTADCNHCQRPVYDISFEPPESDVDEQTSSLLDEGLSAINERYDYIVNNKLTSADDCITVTRGNRV